MKTDKQIEEYFKLVSERIKNQDLAEAINFLSKIIEIEPANKKAITEKLLLEEILKFNNLDVFASTNLFMDPWN